MRLAAVLALFVAFALPTAGSAQNERVAQDAPAQKKTVTTPQADAKTLREGTDRMQRRQEQLEGQAVRSICSNCGSADGGKRPSKAKKRHRRR